MKLTKEQQVFVITTYIKTVNFKRVQDLFSELLLVDVPKASLTFGKNILKYQERTCILCNLK